MREGELTKLWLKDKSEQKKLEDNKEKEMQGYRKEYAKAIKRGIKRHIEECEHMVEVSYEEEDDQYGKEAREHWLKKKEEAEEKLEKLERKYGSINEEEERVENREEDQREEFTEEDEDKARREGWDSASQGREWIKESREMDRFQRESKIRSRLRVVEDMHAIGLSPKEIYSVADEYYELIEEAAGGEEDEDEEEEDEEEQLFE